MSDPVKGYLAKIGSKGGKATGERKKRDPEHYKAMAAKSAKVRKAKSTASSAGVAQGKKK